MIPDKANIDRLGFEAWADNAIMDLIENLPPNCTEMTADGDDVHVRIQVLAKDTVGWVRAYVPGYGWKHHERTIKQGGQP